MSPFSLAFLALLLTGTLLGSTLFLSLGFAPTSFRNLPEEMAAKVVRHASRMQDAAGAIMALVAAACVGWHLAGLLLALVGVAFLFALLWLRPSINRNREKGLEGDAAGRAAFEGLTRTGHALNGTLMLVLLVAFVLIAMGWV